MKIKIYILIILSFTSIWFIQSCSKSAENSQLKSQKLVLPETAFNYFNEDTILNNQATIGRVLFYDKNLSATNSKACASCHFQENAFADGKQFSSGFKTELTHRNSMAFNNLAVNDGFFWDLRESNLQEMVLKPVSNHIEMGFTDINLICKKLEQFPHYKKMFDNAYSNGITINNIANSLQLFLKSIKSNNSKFDLNIDPKQSNFFKDFPNYTNEENYGKQLFMKDGCMNCHNPFSNFQRSWNNWANIGLDLNYADKGLNSKSFVKRFDIMINETEFEGNFKIPSLRNIALTAPYMHDGRFATLNDVMDHYSDNIKNHKNLSWELTETSNQNGVFTTHPKRFNYTKQDKQAIIAFLKTLTDYNMISDPKFSNPFQVEN
jgi:cytochrome c peroxidase